MSRERGGRAKVLIKGAGEQASATAHRLFRCGYRVVMTDLPRPTAIRRTVSFCSAVYEREIVIEGVRGALHEREEVGALPDGAWDHVPVCVDPEARLVSLWRPDVIVDARILKTNLDNRLGDAALVIGLGPGLEAGRDVHFVIETMRGHDLGRIISAGFSSRDTGQPGEIGGYTRERLLRAPVAGTFESERRIGESLAAGDVVGSVADVDPRDDPALCHTLSDKARTISGSVLELVLARAGG
jgi:xanthine dehydrogenase accessory factor